MVQIIPNENNVAKIKKWEKRLEEVKKETEQLLEYGETEDYYKLPQFVAMAVYSRIDQLEERSNNIIRMISDLYKDVEELKEVKEKEGE